MVALQGYSVTELIYENEESTLYRAVSKVDERRVLIRIAAPAEHPSPQNIKRLEREYQLRSRLDPSWAVLPLTLGRYRASVYLVLDDFGGEPLDRVIGPTSGLISFLKIAAGIATAMGGMHQSGIIHKDINPHNILVKRETGEVRITGFSVAALLPEEVGSIENPLMIEGTLAYMSPEQTGRMNRPIDYRSDLYSLGVTLYQMLTGSLPFEAADPMEWVYFHVARQPEPPDERDPTIPHLLSEVLLKLLSKAPEDRYQTDYGLRTDLSTCLSRLESTGRIEPFLLATRDIPDRLQIPRKLYGREEELAALVHAFESVVATASPELMLISGHPGVGKSALVLELQKPVLGRQGLFLTGKFDQLKRNIPYSTIVQAFRDLIGRILTGSEEEISAWRCELQAALGLSGQLIVEVIPQIELILGEQPPVPALPLSEAQNRFNMVFRQFIGVFTKKEHPLVFFMDDLQWVDSASLKLIIHVITHPDTRYFLIVGAYRDTEVSPSHPLVLALDDIRKGGATVREVYLRPLSRENLNQFIADALYSSESLTEPLTDLVYDKTAGNPFFVIQFLKTLYHENLLEFDRREWAWKWDLDRIRAMEFTDNVVEFMLAKLQTLPASALDIMKLMAAVGSKVDCRTLAMVAGKSMEQIRADMADPVSEGLMILIGDTYKFPHDRVQEAAYALIPVDERPGVHLQIGRLLLRDTPAERLEEAIFDIVNQFNLGASLISSESERDEAARLNLLAGRRGMASAAYASATTYFAAGSALLPPDAWETRYDLAYPLHIEWAESEYLSGGIDESKRLLSLVLEHAGSNIDKAAAYRTMIELYTTIGQVEAAINSGLECLRLFGIDISIHPTREQVEAEYNAMWHNLGDRPIEALIELPVMTDEEMKVAMDITSVMMAPAYYLDMKLAYLTVFRMTTITMRYGRSDASAMVFVSLGMVLGPAFGKYKEGYRFGRLAVDMVERYNIVVHKAKVYLIFGDMINFWTNHIRTDLPYMIAGVEAGIESGDLAYASYCSAHIVQIRVLKGDYLEDVYHESEGRLDFVRKTKYASVVMDITGMQRLVQNMRGLTVDFSSYTGDGFDEREFEEKLEHEVPITVCWYHIMKTCARFISHNYEEALASARRAGDLFWSVQGHEVVPEYYYYYSLTMAALYDMMPPDVKEAYMEKLISHRKMLEVWAENCPENFRNKCALVSAEIARIRGEDQAAMRLYEEAIISARDNEFIQNEGISCELAARFYRSRGFDIISKAYLQEARYAYIRWGADGKVAQMERENPALVETARIVPAGPLAFRREQLDLMSVLKASQAISSEVIVSKLVETLMRVIIESAGAQRGFLILLQNGELKVEAEAAMERGEIRISEMRLPPDPQTLSISIINYVRRTGESVVLADASEPNIFSSDVYIARNKPKSVLCLPIIRQAKLVGIVYLENNLVTNAFTRDRLVVLELLGSQAAISLQNATLYTGLQEENAQRRRAEAELQKANRTLRVLSAVNQALIRATEEHALLQEACRIIVDIGGYRMVWIGYAEDDPDKTVRPVAYAGLEQEYLEKIRISWADNELGRGPTGTAIRTGKPSFAKNILTDPRYAPWRAEAIKRGYASSISIPLIVGSRAIGALSLYSKETDAFDEPEVYLLTELAGDLAYGITSLRTREERAQALQALTESEERFRLVAETATDAIIMIDEQSNIRFANPAAERIFGYTVSEIIDHSLTMLMPERLRQRHLDSMKEYIRTGKRHINWSGVELSGLHKSGREVPLEVSYGEFVREGRHFFVGIVRDITERKEAERREREVEAHKREFYRRTILAATEGKLVITDKDEIEKLAGPTVAAWDIERPEDLGRIRGAVIETAVAADMERSRASDFVLAVGEAITNAYKHAGGGHASLHRVADGLLFVVSDRGPGIEALALPEVALKRGYTTAVSLGMGYKVMLSVADRVYLATGPGGTTVAVEMKLHAPARPPVPAGIPDTWRI